jgi:hypothetical protein
MSSSGPVKLASMTDAQLVSRFVSISLAQAQADDNDDMKEFNRLILLMKEVQEELKVRESDQRIQLTALYGHPSPQVRLNAAKATLAVSPAAARSVLRRLVDDREFPQAGDAGMTLWAIGEGLFKPT